MLRNLGFVLLVLFCSNSPGVFAGEKPETPEKRRQQAIDAAVRSGLDWLTRMQQPDGSWRLDDPRLPDRGQTNTIAATAFGLLPFLADGGAGGGKLPAPAMRGVRFLVRKQDMKTGNLGGGMYAHALGTLALAEALGHTGDAGIRRAAQRAVDYIVAAQHDQGGWRYAPRQPGDTSVTSWQLQALWAAQKTGLQVPAAVGKKAGKFLDSTCDGPTEGYRYVPQAGRATPTMTAAGLLCRIHFEGWGPQSPRLIRGRMVLEQQPAEPKNPIYAYYFAQCLHLAGGVEARKQLAALEDSLLESQDAGGDPVLKGSWSSKGTIYGTAGGRLMQTSLSLSILQTAERIRGLQGER